jgi:hypothetical protein
MFLSINTEKAFDKIQHFFKIKGLKKLGIKGIYINIIKAVSFPLRSGVRQGCPFFRFLVGTVFEFLEQ